MTGKKTLKSILWDEDFLTIKTICREQNLYFHRPN